MGQLKLLVIHCMETPANMRVTKAMLKEWHMGPKPKGRGWDRLGYSDIIHRDGEVENVTPYNEDDVITNSEMTWGATGVNSVARHISLEGGKIKDPLTGEFLQCFTPEQESSLVAYIYGFLARHPNAKIAGHSAFAQKSCPNFNVPKFLRDHEIKDKFIYNEN
jgi:N-acetylmuramoyl-L-alanine amidase